MLSDTASPLADVLSAENCQPDSRPSADDYSDCGIVYIATGNRYRDEAVISARSAKEAMPNIPIMLFTDAPLEDPAFDVVRIIDQPTFGMRDKINGLAQSPFRRTLYLDSDTYVCSDLRECFTLLHRFDLLVAHDALRINTGEILLPTAFPEFNCGVIWYRIDRCESLLSTWKDRYEAESLRLKQQIPDQYTFRQSLFSAGVSLYVLPPEFHCMVWESSYVCGEVKLLHGRNDLPLHVLSKQVNATHDARIFKAGIGIQRVRYKTDILSWAIRILIKQTYEVFKIGQRDSRIYSGCQDTPRNNSGQRRLLDSIFEILHGLLVLVVSPSVSMGIDLFCGGQ